MALFLTGVPDDDYVDVRGERPQVGLTTSLAHTCDEAIRSDKFWAMCSVLEAVVGVLRHLLRWAEQCPCLDHLYTHLPLIAAVDEALAKKLEMQWARCPLRGNRTQELSSGSFLDEVLAKLQRPSQNTIGCRIGPLHLWLLNP